jgi:hypothetical protein
VTDGNSVENVLSADEALSMANQQKVTCINTGKDSQVMVNVDEENGDKVITINVDGETETLRLAKGEELSAEDKARLEEKGVYLNHSDNATWIGRDFDFDFDFDHDFDLDLNLEGLSEGLVHLGKGLTRIGDFNHVYAYSGREINCAALGVYVTTNHDGGVYVNGIIGSSGAEEAGLQRGDVISYINDDPTTGYRDLHDALAKYEPGDVVSVTYSRDGVEDRVETQLRAWKDFPTFANSVHARITCDDEAPTDETTRKIIVIKKDKVDPVEPLDEDNGPILEAVDNFLELTDFVAYPNPTDGKFSVQFSAEAVPTVVSVFDASGKEIFRDNIDNFNGYYNREIDLTSHARGGLVLSVEQGGKSFTEQIVLH